VVAEGVGRGATFTGTCAIIPNEAAGGRRYANIDKRILGSKCSSLTVRTSPHGRFDREKRGRKSRNFTTEFEISVPMPHRYHRDCRRSERSGRACRARRSVAGQSKCEGCLPVFHSGQNLTNNFWAVLVNGRCGSRGGLRAGYQAFDLHPRPPWFSIHEFNRVVGIPHRATPCPSPRSAGSAAAVPAT
jgi:hypothetical protein